MKACLYFRQDFLNGLQFTILTHVKVVDSDGRHVAFARVTPELLEFIRSREFDVPDSLLNWKGKQCSQVLPKNI